MSHVSKAKPHMHPCSPQPERKLHGQTCLQAVACVARITTFVDTMQMLTKRFLEAHDWHFTYLLHHQPAHIVFLDVIQQTPSLPLS